MKISYRFSFLSILIWFTAFKATAQTPVTVGNQKNSASVTMLESVSQSASVRGNNIEWDGNNWTKIKGAISKSTAGYGAVVLPGPEGTFFKRNFSGDVNARWFGAVGDDTTDDTFALQNFINYVTQKGVTGYIPNGKYKITATLNIGEATRQNGNNSSFKIRGDAPAGGDGYNINGTRITLYGTGFKSIMQVRPSALIFGEYQNLTLSCAEIDGADYGFLFETIGFTQHKLVSIRCDKPKTAFGILGGQMANGEFVTFDKCSASNVNRFFYMDATAGQSLNHLFIHCSALIRSGGACFELGGSNLGFGIHVIEFEASGISPVTGYTYLINNGISGTAIFDGGRIESCATLVSHTVGSTNQTNAISFNDIEFDGMQTTTSRPLIVTNGASGAYQYNFRSCKFIIRGAKNGFFDTKISPQDGSSFKFTNCSFTGPNMFGSTGANDLGGIEFVDCNFLKISANTTSVSSNVIKINKVNQAPSIGTLGKLNTITNSIWQAPGIPSNLLIYPDFGTKFGSQIIAPAPWVHTGKTSNFPLLQGYGYAGLKASSSPNARLVTLSPESGVYQDVAAISFSHEVSAAYQAVLLAVGNGSFKISLENSITGVEYDHFQMNVQSSVSSQPIGVTLFAAENSGGNGNLRLRIYNQSANNVITLQILSQLVSEKPMATYVNPPAGKTKEFVNYWSANEDMLRIYGRLSIPHKSDLTGSEAGTLPDVESDIYLSANTERIKYYANGKWFEIPRTAYGDAAPASETWSAGDIVYNNHPSSGNALAWICTKSGAPGIWQPLFNQTNDHTILQATEGIELSLLNNHYNIITTATDLSAIVLNLPKSPQNNDELTIKFITAVKSIQYKNGKVASGSQNATAGSVVKLVFDMASNTWY